MAAHQGFVDAIIQAPAGVVLLRQIELLAAPPGSAEGSSQSITAAIETANSLTFEELTHLLVRHFIGPWNSDEKTLVAAYRHRQARRPIAEVLEARFADALHSPIDRSAQEWWAWGGNEALLKQAPLFHRFDQVYCAGQSTWAGFWTQSPAHPQLHQMLAHQDVPIDKIIRWHVPAHPTARVYEIHRPDDWTQLVLDHPREATPNQESWELPGSNQQRYPFLELPDIPGQHAVRTSIRHHLVPDWRSVAQRYDGVHLSWAGVITAEGFISDLPGGDVTMLRYWFTEQTLWLADIFGEPTAAAPSGQSPLQPGFVSGAAIDIGFTTPEERQHRLHADRQLLTAWLGRSV